jgi:hypothetical protein
VKAIYTEYLQIPFTLVTFSWSQRARWMERFIRISRRNPTGGSGRDWVVIPNCGKVAVWELVRGEALDAQNNHTPFLGFHVDYLDGVTRGCRVSYLGESFQIKSVEDSTIRGMEIICYPI